MTELEEVCIQKIAEAKAVPLESVTLDTTLESLAVDSLDLVTLSFDLEEKYGVEIPDARLHQLKTVRDVTVAIDQALTKKVQSAGNGKSDA